MSYGRTPLQELLLDGRRLLTRHYYGDGRWGWRPRSSRETREWQDWRVTKQRPRQTTWAKGSAAKARKVHAIRYVLTAEHTDGHRLYLAVWWCGGSAHTKPVPQSHPVMVCAGCSARLSGQREVPLGLSGPADHASS